MLTTSPTFQVLSDALDRSALRQAVYSANIANANIEGYQRMEVAFESELARANREMVNMGSAGFAQIASAHVISTGEVVALDQEMALLAKNSLQYQMLLGAYEKEIGLLRLAIKEGRE
ncbi:MAG: flagellar basal body protein [Steroidobacteraceae bacterium]